MRFSIIIPAYNAEAFIQRSVQSVINQTYQDFEIIVVDDGSADDTSVRLNKIEDSRLTVIEKSNEGVSIARNTGISHARGEFVCFLDADDEFLPTHLSHLNNLIARYPKEAFFVTRFCVSAINDYTKVTMPSTSAEVFVYRNVIREIIGRSELIWTGCVCIRRDVFSKYGVFAPGVKLGEDTDLWKRIYVHTGIVYSDCVTVKRNRDGSCATRRYSRSFVADPLRRMPQFLADGTILDDVKESLKTEYELTKLHVVRSYLLMNDKKTAKHLMKEIDASRISKKRLLVTLLCFVIPSGLMRWCLRMRDHGLYE